MALQALGSLYWPGDGVGPGPVVPKPGYASWQAAVVPCLLFGLASLTATPGLLCAVVVPMPTRYRWPRWLRILGHKVRLAIPERLWLLWRVACVLWSPAYVQAHQAVRAVAITPHMREKHMWGEIGHRAAMVHGRGENVFRALLAVEAYGATPHTTGHLRNTLIELAYLALKERGR